MGAVRWRCNTCRMDNFSHGPELVPGAFGRPLCRRCGGDQEVWVSDRITISIERPLKKGNGQGKRFLGEMPSSGHALGRFVRRFARPQSGK